jgi:sulfite reductase (NADPH) flavoprotein alpha-component
MSRIECGAALTTEQRELLEQLTRSLKPGQAIWLSGYFAGLERAGLQAVLPPADGLAGSVLSGALTAASVRTLTILFGSETGNCTALAAAAAEAARGVGLSPTVVDMARYKPQRLKEEQDLLIITSTHGEGDPPLSAKPFFEFLASRKAPKLSDLRYAVLALGDSTYEHYCGAGKWIDGRLAELGGTALQARVDCDVDYDDGAAAWVTASVATLEPHSASAAVTQAAITAPSATADGAFDRQRPFLAPIIDNFVLTGRGSSKETRHIELSLDGSGLTFLPGDTLGILPRNDPALVDSLLNTLGLSGDAPIMVKSGPATLAEALTSSFEISAATPRFIDRWAELSQAPALKGLSGDERSAERAAFLRDHHVIDIVRRFPVKGVEPESLVHGLRPLQPRLYSIASSQAAFPDEVHLTISTLEYELNGELRRGVTSGYFSGRAGPDDQVRVYVQPNPHFRLPTGDAPILMIGAGTGVAPYRSFLQDREANGAAGKSWLVFGERNFHSDFLYQTEWQEWLQVSVLTRMTVAFSRDGARKTYVQHKLKDEGREVYAWLQEGAHVFVCGASALAPAIQGTLRDIIEAEGGLSRAAAEDYLATLQSEHRFQVDVY